MTSFLPRLVGVGSVKLIRSFHRSCALDSTKTYEGEGKTTVTVLNSDLEYGAMIDGISTAGFKLNNGISILGPMIIFPKSILGWHIGSSAEINEDSLIIFKVLEPSLDLLIIGLDQKYDNSTPFLKTLKTFAKSINTNIEILQIDHACATFNYLNAEKRYVAAALMPPRVQLPKSIVAFQDRIVRQSLSKAETNQFLK